MRLTNEMRNEFLSDVMAAIPWKNTMTDELAKGEFEKRAFAILPDEVKAMVKKYPGLLARKQITIPGMSKDKLSHNVLPGFGKWRSWSAHIPNIVEDKDVSFDDVRKAVAARDAEDMKRHELRLQLRGVVYHATTVEELEAALPEFKKWLPKPPPKKTKSMALAPVGLVASFKKAGLPVAVKGARK